MKQSRDNSRFKISIELKSMFENFDENCSWEPKITDQSKDTVKNERLLKDYEKYSRLIYPRITENHPYCMGRYKHQLTREH